MLSCLSLLSSKVVRRKVRSIHLYAVSGLESLLDPSINCYSDERKLIHDGGDDLFSTGLLDDLGGILSGSSMSRLTVHRDEGEQIIEET